MQYININKVSNGFNATARTDNGKVVSLSLDENMTLKEIEELVEAQDAEKKLEEAVKVYSSIFKSWQDVEVGKDIVKGQTLVYNYLPYRATSTHAKTDVTPDEDSEHWEIAKTIEEASATF